MRWPNLFGKERRQPTSGSWHEWKQHIADQCDAACIYCALSEASFGGIRNFHIEHFRPKGKFVELENDIRNLYLACGICNVLKSDDWPCEPAVNHSIAAYPDPYLVDYNTLFTLSPQTHEISAPTVAGKYLIERIFLNRPQLILARRLFAVRKYVREFREWMDESLEQLEVEELREVSRCLLNLSRLCDTAVDSRPYRDADTKRRDDRGPRR